MQPSLALMAKLTEEGEEDSHDEKLDTLTLRISLGELWKHVFLI